MALQFPKLPNLPVLILNSVQRIGRFIDVEEIFYDISILKHFGIEPLNTIARLAAAEHG